MGKRSELREVRRKEKLRKFEEQKAATLAKVLSNDNPRFAEEPKARSAPRLAPHLARELEKERERTPVAMFDGSRYAHRVTWCISCADQADQWSWGDLRAWEPKEWDETILPSFTQFSSLTWGEIDRQASDTGHKLHHGHEIQDVCAEAQERWRQLGLDQYDSVFRFRLGNTKRAWGYILQAHFFMIWWDRTHSIYPTEQG